MGPKESNIQNKEYKFQVDPKVFPGEKYPILLFGWKYFKDSRVLPRIATQLSINKANLKEKIGSYLESKDFKSPLGSWNVDLKPQNFYGERTKDTITSMRETAEEMGVRHIVICKYDNNMNELIEAARNTLGNDFDIIVAEFSPSTHKNFDTVYEFSTFRSIQEE